MNASVNAVFNELIHCLNIFTLIIYFNNNNTYRCIKNSKIVKTTGFKVNTLILTLSLHIFLKTVHKSFLFSHFFNNLK